MRNTDPCPIHSTWMCDTCGWTRTEANRLYAHHTCHHCKGTTGTHLDMVHRSPEVQRDCVATLPILAEMLAQNERSGVTGGAALWEAECVQSGRKYGRPAPGPALSIPGVW